MTEAASPAPQPLEIRGRPRPVKRFSKRALMVLVGTGSAIVLGSLAFALQGPRGDDGGPARELYNTGHNPEADGLDALPKSYGELERQEDILGPPLPGDLGTPILKARREGRMGLPDQDVPETDPMGGRSAVQPRPAPMKPVRTSCAATSTSNPRSRSVRAGDSAFS